MLTPVNKKIVSYSIKAAIIFLVFWVIFRRLVNNQNLKDFAGFLKQISAWEIALVLGTTIFLMFLNWGIEVFKWQRLVQSIEKISFWRAVESVFCGLTIAVFTPSRIGEYGGRVFFLSPRRRIAGIVAMAVGNIGQMVLTNIFGSIAICFFINKFVNIDYRLFYILIVVVAAFCGFMAIFYFNIRWVRSLLISIRFTRKYQKFYSVLNRYKKSELFKILLYCLARYIVFSTQYLLLLHWLIPELHYADMIMMLCILFFIQSTLPSLDLFDIGVRSLTATYFFKFITDDHVAVIATTACVWLINIIIPAILGVYFVFKLKFFGNSEPG